MILAERDGPGGLPRDRRAKSPTSSGRGRRRCPAPRIGDLSPPRSRPEPLVTGPFLQLFAFSFVTFFSAFHLFPAIPFRVLALGGTKAQAGLFLALYTWACALAAPVAGAVADHFGRRRALVLGSAAFVAFSLLYAVVTSLPLLFGVAALHGVAWATVLSSSAAVMSEVIPASRRTEGISYWGMASTLAVAVAPAVGLWVFQRGGWALVCLEMAGLSVVMAVLASRVTGGTGRASGPLPRLSQAVDWRVMAAGLSLSAVSFGYGGVTSYVVLLAVERRIQPPSLFFTAFAVAILLSRFATARVGDRFGPTALLLPSLAVLPFALALLASARSPSSLALAAVLYGVGFAGAYPGFSSWALERTDPERRGATFGSILWAFDTGIGTGSFVSGLIAQRFGIGPAFAAGAALSAAAVPLFLLTSRLLPEKPREV